MDKHIPEPAESSARCVQKKLCAGAAAPMISCIGEGWTSRVMACGDWKSSKHCATSSYLLKPRSVAVCGFQQADLVFYVFCWCTCPCFLDFSRRLCAVFKLSSVRFCQISDVMASNIPNPISVSTSQAWYVIWLLTWTYRFIVLQRQRWCGAIEYFYSSSWHTSLDISSDRQYSWRCNIGRGRLGLS